MRLRTFLFVSSFIILLIVLTFFYFQMEATLGRGFDELGNAQLKYAAKIASSVIASKEENLKNFTKLIESDNDFSSAFMLASESDDFSDVDKKKSELKSKGGFDLLEVIPRASGRFSGPPQSSSISQMFHDDGSKSSGVRIKIVNGELTLLSVAPLKLYEDEVGVLVLGYFLNGKVATELGRTLGSEIIFYTDENPPSEGGALFNRQIGYGTEVPLFDSSQQVLHARLQLVNFYQNKFRQELRARMGFIGALSLLLLIVLFFSVFEFSFLRRFNAILGLLADSATRLKQGALPEQGFGDYWVTEIKLLADGLNEFSLSLRLYDSKIKDQLKLEAEAKLSDIARQVAHDIRSPLSGLDRAIESLTNIPEQQKSLVREATQRIKDMSQALLRMSVQSGADVDSHSDVSTVVEAELVRPIVDSIISEKRLLIRSRKEVSLEAVFAEGSYAWFANVNSFELKRVLSNLIDNSLESFDQGGSVQVSLKLEDGRIAIDIKDSGKGIPNEFLPHLGNKGETFGKPGGTGLGLWFAKSVVEKSGGALAVASKVSEGTTVKVTLPSAPAPNWFLAELDLRSCDCIAILDDDPYIHKVWERRITGKKLLHFDTGTSFWSWAKGAGASAGGVVILADYELVGEGKNGLELLTELQLSSSAVLVTNQFEDPSFRSAASKAGVRVLPKPMAFIVPIKFS